MIGSSLLRRANKTVEKSAFRAVMSLPGPALRAFAGRPVVLDGQELAVDTQAMLKLMKLSGQDDIAVLPLPSARRALIRSARVAGGDQFVDQTQDFWIHGFKGRLYIPTDASVDPGPMMVFFHGGGFVYGDVESHDAPCRFLAENSGIRILSVNYRLGPETPFPAAYEDSLSIFGSVLERAAEFGADPARIGVGGDSAGGNLSTGVALANPSRCAFQFLVYPNTTSATHSRSREVFREGFYLTPAFMQAADHGYVPAGTDREDPRLSPMYAEVSGEVAPAYIATAGFDPLRDEGEDYARKLIDAGVKVEVERFPDQIHGFLNCVGAGPTHRAAVARLAEKLKSLAT